MILPSLVLIFSCHSFIIAASKFPLETIKNLEKIPPPMDPSAENINPKLKLVFAQSCQDSKSDPMNCAKRFAGLLKNRNYYVQDVAEYDILIWKVIEKNLVRQMLAR